MTDRIGDTNVPLRVLVPDGFRSSLQNWCGEARPEGREVVERALAHVVRGIERAYARSDRFERRRPLVEAGGQLSTGSPR